MKTIYLTIPFIGVFLFCGFKLQVYNQQIGNMDNFMKNAIYTSIDKSKLRNYEFEILEDDFELQLLKYFALENENGLDNVLQYEVDQSNPLFIKSLLSTNILEEDVGVIKSFILDSRY